ncbi:hypothetical protein [Nocardioides sp.]|uniref:hypothetical protein n=1 Tax=Nocardioides sp. TaxID=35761 RepID=UPI002732DBAD|nr:hypothetical protein [Nocardioides sp.]MDP3892817.1 hypothetical protein [Nocardioides sp.]
MAEWSAPARFGGVAGAIVRELGHAFLVGRAIGPEVEPVSHDTPGETSDAAVPDIDAGAASGSDPAALGLAVTDGGYTLALADDRLPAGDGTELRFAVVGPDGAAVTAYDELHERPLHLIVVRRDLTGFQHVHPELEGGTWSTEIDLEPGAWRVFADFQATGDRQRVLGADLLVPGDSEPARLGATNREAEVDGYTVQLDGDLVAGEESELTLTVRRDGQPVELQPYLGARGHLVALRASDLGYLHVHPEEGQGDDTGATAVTFHTLLPHDGGYRLFFDFRHDGVVRTAAFTVHADPSETPPAPTGTGGHEEESHDH